MEAAVNQQDTNVTFAEAPFSSEVFKKIELGLAVAVTTPIAFIGIVTNIINLIIFYRQGILDTSSSITLTSLAVADLFTCIVLTCAGAMTIIMHFVDTSHFTWSVKQVRAFVFYRPTTMFAQITCVVTCFAASERMISVVLPFRVKSIFTPFRTLVFMVSVFILHVILFIPAWTRSLPTWTFNPQTNVSSVMWRFSNIISDTLWDTFFYVNLISIRFGTILGVIICNGVIFWKVNLSEKFRNSHLGVRLKVKNLPPPSITDGGKDVQPDNFSNIAESTNRISDDTDQANTTNNGTVSEKYSSTKEHKLLRMITAISLLFTICYLPVMLYAILFYIVWDINIDYHKYTSDSLTYGFMLFQVINSCSNLFIYYTMSSRYKEEFHLFFRQRRVSQIDRHKSFR